MATTKTKSKPVGGDPSYREQVAKAAAIMDDPAKFARRILQHDTWNTQRAILRSVRDHRRTAVKACHASSKTFTAAEAVFWWLLRNKRRGGKVVTTAPTWIQVERLLWGEIRKTAPMISGLPEVHKTHIDLGPDNFALGISTDRGVRFQGFHGRVLVILDEAPGVIPDAWEAIDGIEAGGDVHVLALGNPVQTGGPFYEAFGKDRRRWSTFTISAFDTPNLAGTTIEQLLEWERKGDARLMERVRPYLVTREWVVDKYHKWGPSSPMFVARVLGNFPDGDEYSLIPLTWLERASQRRARNKNDDVALLTKNPVEVGIDVAGPGENETVVAIRSGDRLLVVKAFPDRDARGPVMRFLAPWKGRIRAAKVDSIGIGYYMARHLEDYGIPVVDVNVALPPIEHLHEEGSDIELHSSEEFTNLRAQLYWGLRRRAELDKLWGADALDDETMGQLSGIRWHTDNRGGKISIESKKVARTKRGLPSPDRADAVMLAYAPVTAMSPEFAYA